MLFPKSCLKTDTFERFRELRTDETKQPDVLVLGRAPPCMNLMDRVAFGGVARALCVIVASKRPNFCRNFQLEDLLRARETP